ncbi:DUF167 family protein [Pseudomonadales bacterium]|nr:DUF167 family protein [Pseudomonadales bacterium]MDA9315955.1 DUF167 family protein [Pseudomonadales bacterium]MDB4151197.1 DUF167 family protein [Pseudomonadales bacterium]
MFRWQGEDLILELKVIPKSRIDRLEVDADQLKLKIRAMPIDGKANQYLKKYLGKLFSVPQTRVVVEKGQNQTHKSVRLIQPGYLPSWVQQC